MAFSRSERRAERARLLKQRLREQRRYQDRNTAFPPDPEWALQRARHLVTTASDCNCMYCTNPRHYYGNARGGLTMAERRIRITQNEVE
jgi:hypothetical protein